MRVETRRREGRKGGMGLGARVVGCFTAEWGMGYTGGVGVFGFRICSIIRGSSIKIFEEIRRLASEFLLLLVKLLLAAAMVLIDLGIKNFATLVLDPDGYSYKLLVFVMDVTFVGTAAIITVTGAIIISAEFIVSTYRHLARLKE